MPKILENRPNLTWTLILNSNQTLIFPVFVPKVINLCIYTSPLLLLTSFQDSVLDGEENLSYTNTHTYAHAYIHTYIHTHTHTYIHTHT
jgi:hypothetical protein